MILSVIKIYLILVFLNSVDVIVQAIITSKRVFGFAGIMFVDYVGIGVVMGVALTIFSKGTLKRITFSLLTLVFIIALIFTQTRTSWISTFLTVAIVLLFIAFNEKQYGFAEGSIRRFFLSAVIVIIVALSIALYLNPDTFNRLSEVNNKSEPLIPESGFVRNSLVSRFLIWHTAYNAFISNPVLGIGAYAFPFSSTYYYKISDVLFDIYVKGLSPHQTFIAVAVETGIVGLVAFATLLIALVRYTLRTMVELSKSSEHYLSVLLGGSIIYIIISMFTTDAWLWGHGIILFGMLIGLQFALVRIIKKTI
jgi:O-antigen ligase